MIDTILTLPLELMTLTLLVGFGIFTPTIAGGPPVTIAAPAAPTFDMRVDGHA